jgi:hypothetical protein
MCVFQSFENLGASKAERVWQCRIGGQTNWTTGHFLKLYKAISIYTHCKNEMLPHPIEVVESPIESPNPESNKSVSNSEQLTSRLHDPK